MCTKILICIWRLCMYNVCAQLRERGTVPEKKKMGRPTEDEEMKDVRVQIRFDKKTLDKLDALAKKEKMSRSQYVRLLIQKIK